LIDYKGIIDTTLELEEYISYLYIIIKAILLNYYSNLI